MSEELQVPTPATWDTIHALVKGAVGSVPVGGGLAAEFFNLVVKPPLVKKQKQWMESVAVALCGLAERVRSFDPEHLFDNERFSTAVIAITSSAMRTSDEAKLQFLRNTVLNTALTPEREGYEQETLLFLVDRLTSAHLCLLRDLAEYEKRHIALEKAGTDPPMPLAVEFPAITRDMAFSDSLAFELVDLNVVTMPRGLRYTGHGKAFWLNEFGHLGTERLQLTDLGKTLLKHVSEPTVQKE